MNGNTCRWILLVVLMSGSPGFASAEVIEIDLAREQPGSPLERSVDAGRHTLRFLNRLPAAVYSRSIVKKRRAVASLPAEVWVPRQELPTESTAPPDTSCDQQKTRLNGEYEQLETEQRVAPWLNAAKAKLDKCGDEERETLLQGWRAGTTEDVPIALGANEEVTILLARPGPKKGEVLQWTIQISTEARGQWITSYGVATIPDRDELHSMVPTSTAGEFRITPNERRVSEVRLLPVILFTWLGSRYEQRDFAFGPTAGFGAGGEAYSLFLGWSALYNWNIQLSGGVAVFQKKRLASRYSAGELVNENLEDDQLHRKVGWYGWHAALTWRFGDNPFEKQATAQGSDAAGAGK